ncbi:MAG TPA: hypothetical protein VFR47_08470 [Anaerolineales bacterium]|nr:hypothetical protein [Anaerolineales bacterium]
MLELPLFIGLSLVGTPAGAQADKINAKLIIENNSTFFIIILFDKLE